VRDFAVELIHEVKEIVKNLSTEVEAYVNKYYRVPHGSQGTLINI
jgi:hypothetical protein